MSNIYYLTRHEVRTDDDGQPVARGFNWKNCCSKTYDLMRGFATGALADGIVTDDEALAFRQLVSAADEDLRRTYPFSAILERVETILADGVVDQEERAELLAIFNELAVDLSHTAPHALSSGIPLTKPAPEIVFPERIFSVTGKFALGSRNKVVEMLEMSGALFSKNPTKQTHYLIVGTFASRDWLHTDWGRKIQQALDYGIPVVAEEMWHQAISTRLSQ